MRGAKLSVKLIGGFAIVAVFLLVGGYVGWRGISETGDILTKSCRPEQVNTMVERDLSEF
jgi:hypothetical protein